MATLLSTVEKYRCDSEEEADGFIQEQKNSAGADFELKKVQREKRQKKQKGEIVDEWYTVTLNKNFEE